MLEVDEQIRQPVLDRLERSDRPAELQPRLRIVDRQVEQMLSGADLLDGQQRRTHLQGVLDDPLGLAGTGDQPAGRAGQPDGGLRPGQVERDQRAALHPRARRVDGVQGHPIGTSRGDEQVVGGSGIDDPLDGPG